MELKLIVLRTPDPQRLAQFYTKLGLQFDYHRHGNNPYHYSTPIGETVFEIYPLMKNQTTVDTSLRLGFNVNNFYNVLQKISESGMEIVTEPTQIEWGIMAVVLDPDGRKIELYKKENER